MSKREYGILVKKDGRFFVGYCLEVPQARVQGDTRQEAIAGTKKAIHLCKSYLEDKKKDLASKLVTLPLSPPSRSSGL